MLNIYWTYLRTTLALQFQWRVSMALWMIGRLIEPVVYLVVWTTVANARGEIGGYGAGDFAAYYLVLMVVNQLTFTWIMHEYDNRIRSGELSSVLLKPIHPIHSDIADNIGYKVLTLVIMVPAGAMVAALFEPSFATSLVMVALAIPALALAFLLRFFVEWTLALTAFWTTRIEALNQVYFLVILFLSGRIAPIELLPSWAVGAAWVLPFRWMIGFPVELALGRLEGEEIMVGFAMQLAWVMVALLGVRLVWRSGVRRYSAVGS